MSKDVHADVPEITELRTEARRHLEWLRDAGVAEVEVQRAGRERGRGVEGPPQATRSAVSREPAPKGRQPDGVGKVSSQKVSSQRTGAAGEPQGRYALTDKGCGSAALLTLREGIGECSRCKLSGGRKKLVFGVGKPDAELLFVGEGPGADEDEQGEPFVGKAGQLLTRMIEAMGLRREEVYIANVVKCRPPGNRDPEPDEIAACEPFLKAQIAALSPRIIVALGRFAVQTLLRDATPITKQRGRWREYEGVKLMPTFHPAYLLRSPGEKKKAWEDLQLVMKELPGRT